MLVWHTSQVLPGPYFIIIIIIIIIIIVIIILTTKFSLRKVSNYYISKAKAPTAKPFAHICSIEESFHIFESRPYLTSHVITTEKILKLKRHIVLDNKIGIDSNRTTICIMWRIAFLKFALLLKWWCHKHPYLQTFFSSAFIFCVNSNCIREIVKKAMLSLIHLKIRKHTSFPLSLRDSKIWRTVWDWH